MPPSPQGIKGPLLAESLPPLWGKLEEGDEHRDWRKGVLFTDNLFFIPKTPRQHRVANLVTQTILKMMKETP